MSGRGRGRRYEATAGEWVPARRVRGIAELESSQAGHVAAIAAAEAEICRLQAVQVRHGAAYVREQLEQDARSEIPGDEAQHRVMVAEVAAARKVSSLSASSW